MLQNKIVSRNIKYSFKSRKKEKKNNSHEMHISQEMSQLKKWPTVFK